MDERHLIRIRGARTHNLKNIDLDLPRDRLIVVTGLSGSGKSSLAFDTLYAEGQRRYVESLSAYARQFLQRMDKPDVDLVEGLSPAISIEQKATSHNPRSTVGTVTEIHDYLRLLFARAGTPHCPDHDLPLESQTISQMVDHVLALPLETKLMIVSPIIVGRKGEHADFFADLRAQGFSRLRIDGQIHEIDALPKLAKTKKHDVDIVVDRLRIREDMRQRLAESFETALRHADGRAAACEMDSGKEHVFSAKFACPLCSYSLPELEPRIFSFNNPIGACPECDGLGVIEFFDAKRIVTRPDLSLKAGAIRGWDNHFTLQLLRAIAAHYHFDLDTPFCDLPERIQDILLYGSGEEPIRFRYFSAYRTHPFEGIVRNFERRYRETDSPGAREELAKLISTTPCPACGGARLGRDARHVRIGHGAQALTLHEINRLSLAHARDYFLELELAGNKKEIAEKVLKEITGRLQFLIDVGLDYLSLDRSAETLSGGEAQRIRLASQIGSGLTGVMYVLDEPSIGLHQRDNHRLLKTLRHLRDIGNTVIVVEHDEDAIRSADHVVDIGPGAGIHGGFVVAEGTPECIESAPASLTGDYLAGRRRVEMPEKTRRPDPARLLKIVGARGNNLKSVTVEIPVGLFTCVTGVSGSGKSTLVNDTLFAAAARHLYASSTDIAEHDEIVGLDHFDKVISVDQSPIGRTPRSNPATYTGLLTPIRELFSGVPEARSRGYSPGRFSFNVKGGRCEACQGDGVIKVEMHFLPDIYISCDVCHGKRYNRETLEIRYKEKNIHDILQMTVEQAREFFDAVPAIARKLQTLVDVGLSYITLGQSATTLSGGEAQRVKLALELSKRDTGRTLYILDEPTTGLHFQDIAMLLDVLHRLTDQGNTVVVIEHNLDVIKTADWIVDLGPEGGDGGGRVLVAGTPKTVADDAGSYTGHFLKPLLARPRPSRRKGKG
ncbi:MAG: excinuclease ABC subunit UvrA [Candidatus Accumulibacter sp.]|jgi:excinuclease ABC subunit A|nr:excinuclease ABC subunit UvrA [Accumulibacter sp.]